MNQHFEHSAEGTPYQDLSDQALANMVHEGDDNAFAELWGRHDTVARRATHYDATLQDAEDNAQDVALKLWLDLRRGREFPAETARPFIGRMALNNMRDNYRKRSCRPPERLVGEYGDEVLGSRLTAPSAEDIVVSNITVEELLSSMKPSHRDAVQGTIIDGSRYAEHAEDAGMPVGTVKSRVHHAIASLRTTLADGRGNSI